MALRLAAGGDGAGGEEAASGAALLEGSVELPAIVVQDGARCGGLGLQARRRLGVQGALLPQPVVQHGPLGVAGVGAGAVQPGQGLSDAGRQDEDGHANRRVVRRRGPGGGGPLGPGRPGRPGGFSGSGRPGGPPSPRRLGAPPVLGARGAVRGRAVVQVADRGGLGQSLGRLQELDAHAVLRPVDVRPPGERRLQAPRPVVVAVAPVVGGVDAARPGLAPRGGLGQRRAGAHGRAGAPGRVLRQVDAEPLAAAPLPGRLVQEDGRAADESLQVARGVAQGGPGRVAAQDPQAPVDVPGQGEVVEVVLQAADVTGVVAVGPVGAHVGVPGGPGAAGAQQGQEHRRPYARRLLEAADLSGEHRHGGGDGELVVAVVDRLNHLPLGLAGLAVGGVVARRGPPGDELGAGLVTAAQVPGHVEALPVDGVHGGALLAVEGLHAVLEGAHLLQGDRRVAGGGGHRPLVVPAQVEARPLVEQVGALGLPGEAPHEGGQALPLLPAPGVVGDQLGPGVDLELLVVDLVGPGDGLRHQCRALRAARQGVGVAQALDNVVAVHQGAPS